MMCVFFFFFFVSVTTFLSMDPVSDRKVNVVGTLGGQNVRKNPKKITEKLEFLRKTSFLPNRFFYMVVNQKLITAFIVKIFTKSVENAKMCKIKNTTLNWRFFYFLKFSSYIQILTKILAKMLVDY
ncbi:hypothetical protein FWK35_00007521, partial [Aphis craccivora]